MRLSMDGGADDKMEDCCRLCDENCDQMFSVFDKNDDGVQILQLIKECLPIIIYRTDPLPKSICESCNHNINMLYKFKKAVQETADRQKEKLRSTTDPSDAELPLNIKLFLACGEEAEDGSELKDASTSTDDLQILCTNCKQTSVNNGELELCSDLHKAIEDSMKKNKISTEKLLRRRKVVPFYHELDDSLCSSLTEYTQNTEGSQCFSDEEEESLDSDQTNPRSNNNNNKRRRVESDDDNESNSSGVKKLKKEDDEEVECNYEEMFGSDEEYSYQPLSLLQLCLNIINKSIVPDYEPEHYVCKQIYPECFYCKKVFQNVKLLALHEVEHIDIEVGEKIDHPSPWHPSRQDADVRNKWLNYFDENGYDDDDIVIDNELVVNTENLLIPLDDKKSEENQDVVKSERVVLKGTQPVVNGLYLGDYTKEERKAFYQSMRIQGVNKKFCDLCRYIFKDNWAIESHYFSSACYYTCRYCGMRFNKQRHKFEEHVEDHKAKGDVLSIKIFAASKLSNVVPKIIHPPKEKPKKMIVTAYNSPYEAQSQRNGVSITPPTTSATYQSIRVKNLMERRSLQTNLQIKEEPQEPNVKDVVTSQSKTGNQAYFCRKCYKVFFKLDEFNIHSKNCDYNQFPQVRNFSSKPVMNNKNGEVSPAGRPLRHCAKEAGTYKDEVYLPELAKKEQKTYSFVCFICNTPFPTVYSRNSHMRIHKGEVSSQAQAYRSQHQQRAPQNTNQYNYRTQSTNYNTQFNPEIRIKEEPMDMPPMEPMVEIHEQQQVFPETIGDGAVSITPISRNPKQKATISPSIMKMVQNNPQLSICKKVPERSSNASQAMNQQPADADKTYKCSSCWEAFANKSHLYFHKKNQCEGSRLPCPFCKKRFGTEAEYSSHIYYSHPE